MTVFSSKILNFLSQTLTTFISLPQKQAANAYNFCAESFKNQLGRALGSLLSQNQLVMLQNNVESINEFLAKQAV